MWFSTPLRSERFGLGNKLKILMTYSSIRMYALCTVYKTFLYEERSKISETPFISQ